MALKNGKFDSKLPFFEGEDDHRVPTIDASLLRSGIFKAIGTFMVHSAIHTGIAFVGLSEAVAQYLISNVTDPDTPFSISINDIPSYDVRCVVRMVRLDYRTAHVPNCSK